MQIIIILFLFLISSVHSLIGYDCTDPGTQQLTVSLISKNNCSDLKIEEKSELVQIQVLQDLKYYEVDYFSCFISIDYEVYRCGSFFKQSRFITKDTKLEQLTKTECLNLHLTKRYVHKKFKNIDITLDKEINFKCCSKNVSRKSIL